MPEKQGIVAGGEWVGCGVSDEFRQGASDEFRRAEAMGIAEAMGFATSKR